jgi:hypothetical protein
MEQADRSREMMIPNESIYDNPFNENEEDIVKIDLENVKTINKNKMRRKNTVSFRRKNLFKNIL